MYTRSYTTERDGRTFVVNVLPDGERETPVSDTIRRRKRRGKVKRGAKKRRR